MAARVEPFALTLVLRQHATLVRQGAPGEGIWLVRSGALRIAQVSQEGRELVLDVAGPGACVGEPSNVSSPATVRALRPCRLVPVPPRREADLLVARAHRAAALAAEFAFLDVRDRVTARLADLADRFGRPVEDGRLIVLPLTQEEVAALAGTTRESANRALRSMEADGAIRIAARGRYVVRAQLRALVTNGAT